MLKKIAFAVLLALPMGAFAQSPKFGHIKVLFVAPNTFRGFKILRRKILLANCPLREIFLISSSKDHHFTLYYADLCENIDWKAHHARC